MKRLLLSVAALTMCASLAVAAEAPKPAAAKSPEKPKAIQPAAAKPAAPAKIQDSAIQQIDAFIAGAKIDKKNPAWRTSLPKPPVATFDKGHTYYVRIATTEGPILIKFLPDVAPMHVTNFIYLTRLGYYDGLAFHRVIPGFMAQGGCPLGTGGGGPGYQFAGEFSPAVKHDKPGLLSMANAGPGTDGSQFFLTFVPTPWLDGKHTIFGEVVEGMDTLQKLEAAGSKPTGRPTKPLKMTNVTIEVK
jgi:cyclophilin family peptidyl-prolyl cis-trans isomerase